MNDQQEQGHKPQQSAVLSLLQQAASETQQIRAELLALQLCKHVSKRTSVNVSSRGSIATDDAASRASQQALELQEPTGERRAPPRAPDEAVIDMIKPALQGLRKSQGRQQQLADVALPAVFNTAQAREQNQLSSSYEQPQPGMLRARPRTSSDLSSLARPLDAPGECDLKAEGSCAGLVSLLLSPRTTQERLQDEATANDQADMVVPKLRPATSVMSQANSESVLMGSPMAPAQCGATSAYVARAIKTPQTLFQISNLASPAACTSSKTSDAPTQVNRDAFGLQLITKDKRHTGTPTKHVSSPRAGAVPGSPGVGIAAKINPTAGQQPRPGPKAAGLRAKLGMAPVRSRQPASKPTVTGGPTDVSAPVTKLDVLARLQKANEAFKKMHPDTTSTRTGIAGQISTRGKAVAGKVQADGVTADPAAAAGGPTSTGRQQLYMSLLKRGGPGAAAAPADKSHLTSKTNSIRLDPDSIAGHAQERPTAPRRGRPRSTAADHNAHAAAGFVIVRCSTQDPQQLSAGGAVTSVSLQQFLAPGVQEQQVVAATALQQLDSSTTADVQVRDRQASMGKVFESLVAMHARGSISPFKARYADTGAVQGVQKLATEQAGSGDAAVPPVLFKALLAEPGAPAGTARTVPATHNKPQAAARKMRPPSAPKQPKGVPAKQRPTDKPPSLGGSKHAADAGNRRATSAPANRAWRAAQPRDVTGAKGQGRKQTGATRSPRSTGAARVAEWDIHAAHMEAPHGGRPGVAKSPWLAHQLVDEPGGPARWLTTCVGAASASAATGTLDNVHLHDAASHEQHMPVAAPAMQQQQQYGCLVGQNCGELSSASPGTRMKTFAVAAAAVLAGQQRPANSLLAHTAAPPPVPAASIYRATPPRVAGASSVFTIAPRTLLLDEQQAPEEAHNAGSKPTDGQLFMPASASRRAMSPSVSHVSGRLSRPTHEDLALSEMSVIMKKGAPGGPQAVAASKDLAGLSPEEVLRRSLRRTGPPPRASPVRPHAGTQGLAPHLVGVPATKPRGYAAAAVVHASPGSPAPHYATATASSAAKLSPQANLSPNHSKACLTPGGTSPSPSRGPLTPRDLSSTYSASKAGTPQSVRQALHRDGPYDRDYHPDGMTSQFCLPEAITASVHSTPAKPQPAREVAVSAHLQTQLPEHRHAPAAAPPGGSTSAGKVAAGSIPQEHQPKVTLDSKAGMLQPNSGDAHLAALVSQLMQDHATEVAALGLDHLRNEGAPGPASTALQHPADKHHVANCEDEASGHASKQHPQDAAPGDQLATVTTALPVVPQRPSAAASLGSTAMASSGRCCMNTVSTSSQGRSSAGSPRSSRSSAADMLSGGYASRLRGAAGSHLLQRNASSSTPALTVTAEEPATTNGTVATLQQPVEAALGSQEEAASQQQAPGCDLHAADTPASRSTAAVCIADTSHGLELLRHLPASMTVQQLQDVLAQGVLVQTATPVMQPRPSSLQHSTAPQRLHSPPPMDGCMGCFPVTRRSFAVATAILDRQAGAAPRAHVSSVCKVALTVQAGSGPVLSIQSLEQASQVPANGQEGACQAATKEVKVQAFTWHQPEQSQDLYITVVAADGVSLQLTHVSAHDHAALVLGLNIGLLVQDAGSSSDQLPYATPLHALAWAAGCM